MNIYTDTEYNEYLEFKDSSKSIDSRHNLKDSDRKVKIMSFRPY